MYVLVFPNTQSKCLKLEILKYYVRTHIRQVNHDPDHLDTNLPLWDMQDVYSNGPTQEIHGRSCRLYGSHPATWAISYRSHRSGVYLACLTDLDHEVGIDHTDHTDHTDHLPEVWNLYDHSPIQWGPSRLFFVLPTGVKVNVLKTFHMSDGSRCRSSVVQILRLTLWDVWCSARAALYRSHSANISHCAREPCHIYPTE